MQVATTTRSTVAMESTISVMKELRSERPQAMELTVRISNLAMRTLVLIVFTGSYPKTYSNYGLSHESLLQTLVLTRLKDPTPRRTATTVRNNPLLLICPLLIVLQEATATRNTQATELTRELLSGSSLSSNLALVGKSIAVWYAECSYGLFTILNERHVRCLHKIELVECFCCLMLWGCDFRYILRLSLIMLLDFCSIYTFKFVFCFNHNSLISIRMC